MAREKDRSLELHDTPRSVDPLFNFVPASCFEIAASLSLLDKPGKAGLRIDKFTQDFLGLIKQARSEFGNDLIDPPNGTVTVNEYLNKKILERIHPDCDQIGRCLDPSLSENWYKGAGWEWLEQKVSISSADESHYNFQNMLTKIKVLGAAGSILRDLAGGKKTKLELASKLFQKPAEIVEARYKEFTDKVYNATFNEPEKRARTERAPLIDGRPITDITGLKVKTTEAGPKKLGFGTIYHADEMEFETPDAEEAKKTYTEQEARDGRQGMLRRGQAIEDLNRPGILSEDALAMMPAVFKDKPINLPRMLKEHKFNHGAGVNRWQLHGTYSKESWEHGFIAAGAHSGGVATLFSSLNILSDESVFGKPESATDGLLMAAFMNFGGYHSFIETFPIAQAVARNEPFLPTVTPEQRNLYQIFIDEAKTAGCDIQQYYDAFLAARQASLISQDSRTREDDGSKRSTEALDLAYPHENSYHLLQTKMPPSPHKKEPMIAVHEPAQEEEEDKVASNHPDQAGERLADTQEDGTAHNNGQEHEPKV